MEELRIVKKIEWKRMQENRYLILAYYYLKPIHDPHQEVKEHKLFFKDRDLTSRIYISEQGINGQMSGINHDAHAYIEWMKSRPEFHGIEFKLTPYHEQVFPRATIKYRKNVVGYSGKVDFSTGGEHVDPARWKEMLDDPEKKILIDVRNDYEWKIGHFEGAELPLCGTFRDFDKYTEELKAKVDPKKTPVMMYCTGGIRCELYSSILKERGFENVYQLDGGIINYGMKEGAKHWLGKLFVFDDRMVTPISEEEAPAISTCHFCAASTDAYYNCANMDCNALFLCCPECLKEYVGCCKDECKCADRVRPYHDVDAHKPFRRSYNYLPK